LRLLPLLAPLALLPLPVLAQGDDEGFLTEFIEENLSATAREVDIQGFAGALSSRATVERLSISDGQGVWLVAEDLSLDWNRSALLGGRIDVEELTAGSIEILRAPIPDPQAPSPEATPFSLPELPVSVQIGTLRADRIVLAAPLLGEELVLTLAGNVNLEGGEGSARVTAEIVEGSQGSLVFAGSYSNATRVLAVDLDLQEAEGGLAARALDLPGLPAVSLQVEGTAPIDDYEATLTLATAGEPRVAGSFALQTTGQGAVVERAFGLDLRGDVTSLLAPGTAAFLGPDVVLRTKGIRRSDGSLVLTSLGIRGEAVSLNGQAEITPEGWPARIDVTGRIGVEDGTPVPLPGFEGLNVRGVDLRLDYDRAEGEAWTGTFAVDSLSREGLVIDALSLEGGGTIRPASGEVPGRFTADLGYAAQGLAFTDASLGSALGADLTGRIDLVRDDDGGPLAIRQLTLSGPGLEAQLEGTVAGAAEGFRTNTSLQLQAEDLARFAELSGLDLGGSADVTVVSSVRPLDGIFDLVLRGSAQDLEIGIAQIDPLLAGAGEVRVSAARDETGLRLDTLSVTTDAVTASAEADLTSGQSEAVFDLALTDLGLAFPALDGAGTVQGTFQRDAVGQATLDAQAELPGARLVVDAAQAPLTTDAQGRERPGAYTFTATAAIEDLARYGEVLATFAPDLPAAPAGAAELSLSGSAEADLDRFDVTVTALTQDLAIGTPAFDAAFAGEGRHSGRVIRTDIDALRVEDLVIDTPLLDGTLSADIAEGTGSAELDLSLADVEPVLGGISGPGRVAGTASRTAAGTTDLDLDLTLPTGTASVTGTLAPPLEGFAFTGDAAVDFEDIAPLGELAGREVSGAVEGTASGTIRPDLSVIDLALDLSTRDLALGEARLDALLAGDGTFAGRVARDGADLRIEDLRIDTDLVEGEVSAAIADGVGSADIDLAVADVAPLLGGLSGPGSLTGTARQTGEGTTALDLRATLPTGAATVRGTLASPEEGFAFTGDIAADFEDVAPLGAFAGRDLSGAVQATANGTIRPDLSLFDLTVEARTEDLTLGIAPVDALLEGDGTFAGRVARMGPESFLAEGVTIDTPLLDGTVAGTFENGAGSAEIDLALADVAPVLGGLSGPGRLTGTATGAGGGAVDLDLAATLPTGTAAIDGQIDLRDANTFTGQVEADFADIAPLGPLVGRDLGGALRGTAEGTVRPDLSLLDLAFDVTTQDLRTGTAAVDPLLAGPGTFSGRVTRSPEGDLSLDIDADTPLLRGEIQGNLGPDSGDATFDVALADVGPLVPNLSGPARATGTASRAADGSIAVDATATAPGARVTVAASVAPPDQGSEITGTADVDIADLSLLSPFVGQPLSGGFAGTVSGSARPDLSSFDLALDGTATDLSPGNATLARFLAGTGTVSAKASRTEGGAINIERLAADFPNIDATAQGTADGDTTTVSFDTTLADLGLFVPDLPGAVSANGTATLTPAGAAVDAQVTGPGGISARLSGPLGGATTDLAIAGEAPLALANTFLGARRLAGTASYDLRLSGTPSLDGLSGTVSVQGARLADPNLGEAVIGIDGTATIASGVATVALTGQLATGGSLAVSGPVSLAPPLEADLSIAGTGLVIRDPALYEARGDARLTVRGPLTGGALIAGVASLSTVELRVPSSGVGALGEIPRVFHIEPSLPVAQTLERADLSLDGGSAQGEAGAEGGGGGGFGLDILLDAPNQVFVRGRGLDAELGGQLRLTGSTANVIPIGQFSLLRGRLSILGQRFDLTEGQATLQGDFNPFLRLVATTEARTGTVIRVVLEGPLASPEVTFESTPELPPDEVLAQLLFGVDIESITPFQAIQLASAVAELSGGGGSLVDDLRAGAGLADFDVTTTESGNVALRLGRYISENVYTDVIVSPEETEATINLDLSPDLTVRAGVSTEGETTLGIFFERDY
jgi:hypothetical protein